MAWTGRASVGRHQLVLLGRQDERRQEQLHGLDAQVPPFSGRPFVVLHGEDRATILAVRTGHLSDERSTNFILRLSDSLESLERSTHSHSDMRDQPFSQRPDRCVFSNAAQSV